MSDATVSDAAVSDAAVADAAVSEAAVPGAAVPVEPRRRRIRRRRQRRGRVVVPSLVAGVGLALSLPPWGFWVLAFPAAGLLWWRLRGLRLRARLLAGWAMGLGLFVPGLWWATTFNSYGGIVLMAVESLAPGLACVVVPKGARGRTAALAGAMVLGEALRSTWPFGGLPMGGVALGQASSPLAGAARLGGPLVLVGLVWLGGGGLAILATAVAGRRLRPRNRTSPDDGSKVRRGVLAGVAVLAVVVGIGAWGAVAPDGGPAVHTLRVASVQGGGVRGLRKADVDPATVTAAQFAATTEIASHDGGRAPSLVVWPEDVVSLDLPIDGTEIEKQLGALAKAMHVTLLVGVTETVVHPELSQRDRRLLSRRRLGGALREGPSRPLRGVHPVPGILQAPGQPLERSPRCHPGPRQRRAAHSRRSPRDARVV